MARFRFEAQVAAKLSRRTRHIVTVTDHGEEYGYAYLVMELVAGESLEKLIQRDRMCSLQTIAPIIAQVAKGLSHAHADGVLHRDLKPANIVLSHDEDGRLLVKILDFGIAKTARSHKITGAHTQHATDQPGHSTEVGVVLGTPNYMSPEQARGLSTLDHRCDLWALATIAYEALCGTMPYDGETTADLLVNICSVDPVPVRAHRPELPASVEAFFTKAFAALPARRFQTATELASAFEKLASEVADAPTGAREIVQPAPPPRLELVEERNATGALALDRYEPPRRRTGMFVVLGAVAVIALIAVALRVSQSTAKSAASSAPEPTPTTAPTPTATLAPSATTVATASAETSATAAASAMKTVPKTTPVQKPTAPAPAPKKPVDKGEIL
jgi:serine/threonine-protein kinase